MSDRIDGVVCLWKWIDSPTRRERNWELVESFPIDSDGHPLVKVANCGDIESREPWAGWMNKKTDDDYDREPIMGRAVTLWNWGSGVSLVEITPPDDWVRWLSITFYEELCKGRNWISMVEQGHTLYFGTQNSARGHLEVVK